jgi:hypothetical protein
MGSTSQTSLYRSYCGSGQHLGIKNYENACEVFVEKMG